jgi:hypothetical protein
MNACGWIGLAGVGLALLVPQEGGAGQKEELSFRAIGTNEFVFDTGVLRGKLHADGKSRGLSSVIHIPSGTRLDASMGLFSHYRVFSSNKRYGAGAWDWPSEAALRPDGSVEVRWPAAADRPFELGAVYRWAAPDTLDLETTVLAKTNLAKFESFLASYFTPGFTNSLVNTGAPGTPNWIAAEPSHGVWLVFPRDDSALKIIQDGRWKFEPNPVDWVVMPEFSGTATGIRREPVAGLAAVLMSPRKDCFAVFTPHQMEPHYSMYLSLFGRDLQVGEKAAARCRLVVGPALSTAEVSALAGKYQ